MGLDEAFERILDGLALAELVFAKPGERGRGTVGDGAIGQDLAFERLDGLAEIVNGAGVHGEAREAFGGGEEHGANLRGASEEADERLDLQRIEHGAFDAELLRGDGNVRQTAEAHGLLAFAQILHGFAGIGEQLFERGTISGRLQLGKTGLAERACDKAPDDRAQRFVFEDVSAPEQNQTPFQ